MATENTQSPTGTAAETQPSDAVNLDQIRTIVSGIVSSTLKASLPKVVQETLSSSLKTALDAELAPIREKLTAAPAMHPDKGKQDDKEKAPEVDPRIADLEKKLAKMGEDNRAFRAQAEAERKRARETKAFGDLRQQLTGKVRPDAIDVVADLMRARGLVAYDDDGNVSMKVRRAPMKGMPEEDADLPLSEALPFWLGSKEAQLFLPPPSAPSDGKRAGFNGPAPRSQSNGTARSADPVSTFESQYGSLDDFI